MTPRPALLLLLLAAPIPAADPPKLTAKAATADPPAELAPAVRDLLDRSAVTVSDPAGAVCTFWLRKEVPTGGKGEGYRRVAAGTLAGAVRLARPWADFKTQEAPAGVYTLRLAVQPESKDHEGTAPHRDFVLLVPAAADPKPDVLPLKVIVEKSGTATGGTHPVVMLLYPNPKPAAGPELQDRGKGRVSLGVNGPGGFGWAFTVRGATTD